MAENAQEGVEDRINESLEDRGSRCESHRHDSVLIKAIKRLKGGLRFMAGGYSEIGESGTNIKGGYPVGGGEVVHDSSGEGNWVLVEFNLGIEVSIVDDEAKLTGTVSVGRVTDEENGGRGVGFRGANKTALEFEVKELFELFKLLS